MKSKSVDWVCWMAENVPWENQPETKEQQERWSWRRNRYPMSSCVWPILGVWGDFGGKAEPRRRENHSQFTDRECDWVSTAQSHTDSERAMLPSKRFFFFPSKRPSEEMFKKINPERNLRLFYLSSHCQNTLENSLTLSKRSSKEKNQLSTCE